jgi:hypothetical protein
VNHEIENSEFRIQNYKLTVMPLPWLRIIDGVLGATDVVRWVRGQSPSDTRVAGASRLETRLAGVVVSALKEAFDRDHQRLELERQRLDEERERAERLLRLEWLRQAGEREIGRLRALAAVALASWLGTLFLVARVTASGTSGRVMLGLTWLFLLSALASAFSAQSRVAEELGRMDDRSTATEITRSMTGLTAPWLIIAGLATIAVSLLFT